MKKFERFQGRFSNFTLLDLADHFDDKDVALLLSGSEYDSAKYSILALFPKEKIAIHHEDLQGNNPWNLLKKKMIFDSNKNSFPEWIGYFSYEMGAFHDTYKIPFYRSDIPLACFQKFSFLFKLEISSGMLVLERDEGKEYDEIFSKIKKILLKAPKKLNVNKNKVLKTFWSDTLESYREKINIAKEHIFAGDIYQINLSQKFIYKGSFHPLNLYRIFFEENPTPFSAFISFEDFYIISTSPERLLLNNCGYLETRPIKGTAKRGFNSEEDFHNKMELLNSVKNRAELLMITDLMRNDLSKISEPGSVHTEKIWHCESYKNVFHLLSVIHSKLNNKMDVFKALKSVFPGGSITGCPKIRAMEIIYQIEKEARGIYTGSIGYFCGNGDFDFNIAIRTLLLKNNEISLRLGGAIMAESNSEEEFQETLMKGHSVFKYLK